MFENNSKILNSLKCIFVLLVCVVSYLFLMCLSDSVSFPVYKKIFETYLFACLETCLEVWTNFVRSVCLWFVWTFRPKWSPSPHPHPRRQCQSSLPGEKIWGGTNCLMTFWDSYEKIENLTKMITSCSIRRVGRRWIQLTRRKCNSNHLFKLTDWKLDTSSLVFSFVLFFEVGTFLEKSKNS